MTEREPAWSVGGLAVAGCGVFLVATLVDLLTAPWPVRGTSLFIGAGLGAAVGLLGALGFGALLRVMRPLRRSLQVAMWLSCGLVAAFLVLTLTEALTNLSLPAGDPGTGLDGRNATAAIVLTLVTLGVQLAQVLALQPSSRRHPLGWLDATQPHYRWLMLLFAVASFSALNALEGSLLQYPGPLMSLALRGGGLWILVLGVVGVLRWRPLSSKVLVPLSILSVLCLALGTLPDARRIAAFERVGTIRFSVETLRWIFDLDRDGHSALLGGGDCDDLDGAVHSRRPEVAGNGKDDNCRYGDLPEVSSRFASLGTPPSVRRPRWPIVLVTVDSLRRDHVGSYRRGALTTPALDSFGQGARVFTRAYTSGGYNALVLPSLFHGLYARRLRYRFVSHTTQVRWLLPGEPELGPGELINGRAAFALASEHNVLAGMLRQVGYHTAAVVDDGPGAQLAKALYAPGFVQYREVDELPQARRNGIGTTQLALEELRSAPGDKPLFLWVHYHDLHMDSLFPPWATVRQRYMLDVRALDQQLGRLLTAVEKNQPDAVVVVASTNGARMKRSRYHGRDVAEPSLRVPLFIAGPKVEPGRDERLVSTVDLLPTLLRFAGRWLPPDDIDGIDLFDPEAPRGRTLISEAWSTVNGQFLYDYIAAFDGRYKVVINRRSLNAVPLEQAPDPGRAVSPVDVEHWQAVENVAWKFLEETGYAPGAAFAHEPPLR